MRVLIIILLFLFSNISKAVTYYVSSSDGNDDDSGLTEALAWATIAKVNAATFSAGDSVLFKRGDSWREQLIPDNGSAVNYIYYGDYGSGAKPLLLGSKEENDEGDWTDLGSNIWQNNDASFTIDVGNLIFNGESSCGIKQMAASPTLDHQGDFWYDFTNDLIKIYSVGNPATVYTDIECALTRYIVDWTTKSYIIFQNLDFRYSGADGLSGHTTDHIIVRDCTVKYIGGGDLLSNYTARWGNGIQFFNNAHDNLIERCYISNCYDAGVSPQGDGTSKNQNIIYIYNNLIDSCEFSAEIWMKGATCTMDSVFFENNTCVEAGTGWAHNQRSDNVNESHLKVYTNTATVTNIFVRNNIFYKSSESLISFSNASNLTSYTIDYNDLYQSAGYIGMLSTTGYNSIADWRTASSQDANSIDSDPLLVSTTDYDIQSGSPAIGAGVTNNLATDYEGKLRSFIPDIGAYEYGTNPPAPSGTVFGKHNGKFLKHNGKLVKINR